MLLIAPFGVLASTPTTATLDFCDLPSDDAIPLGSRLVQERRWAVRHIRDRHVWI